MTTIVENPDGDAAFEMAHLYRLVAEFGGLLNVACFRLGGIYPSSAVNLWRKTVLYVSLVFKGPIFGRKNTSLQSFSRFPPTIISIGANQP